MNKKWTYEKIKYFVEVESNSSCELLSTNCEGLKDSIDLRCKCGNPFTTKFKYFHSEVNKKRQCDECGKMALINDKLLNILEIKDYVDNNSLCTLITKEYNKSLQLLEFKCQCGTHFTRTFPSFKISIKMCDECTLLSKKNTMNTSFGEANNLFLTYGLKIITLEKDFINLQQKLSLIDDDGYKYYTKYAVVKQNGTACKFSSSNLYSIENIHLWLRKNNKTFSLISDIFISATKKLYWKCNTCGSMWDNSWATISTNVGCPYCKGKRVNETNGVGYLYPYLFEEFDYNKNNISLYDITIGSHIDIWWECKKCKCSWKTIVNNRVRHNTGCPECNKSKGEKKIAEVLSKISIFFDNNEYTFDDLIGLNGGLLRFDIPIFWDVEKTQLRTLIEFDGEQHYKWIKGWQTKKAFETLQYHDLTKNNYCILNNIPLIRIPYYKFDNIEGILIDILVNNNNNSEFLVKDIKHIAQ